MRSKILLPILCALALQFSQASAVDTYKFLHEIPIGGEGGWDILTIDTAARRLYLSHATKVALIDLERDVIAGEIADTPGVHGFVVAPELQRGFSSNGKEAKASVVELKRCGQFQKSRRARIRMPCFTSRSEEKSTCLTIWASQPQ